MEIEQNKYWAKKNVKYLVVGLMIVVFVFLIIELEEREQLNFIKYALKNFIRSIARIR
jgi:predicted negative regulator of RcsB-dependent stress response